MENVSFKLNDIYYESWLPDLYDRMMWLRHKERKFGPGCIALWQNQKEGLQKQLVELLTPLDQILSQKPFLICDAPYFVDFDLFGILGNYLFSGHNAIHPRLTNLKQWHEAMKKRLSPLRNRRWMR